jgi:hypothetical protein
LAAGATVRGRVVDHGKPVAGIEVGLVQTDRSARTFLGASRIGTDASGRFLFANVSANDDYYVYGIMESLGRRGGISEKQIHVGADDSETDVGELKIEPAFHIRGRIALSDGKPIPAHTRVLVGREQAWDSQIIEADANGAFSAIGIPRGVIKINASIPNYRDSPKNKSLDRLHRARLKGFIDKDIDGLVILFEPGKLVRRTYPNPSHALQAAIKSYERLEVEPLMGVTADLKAFEGTEPQLAAIELPAKPRKPLPKVDLPAPLPEPVAADANVPKRAVTGRVTDDAGKPIADAEVWLPVRWAPPNRNLTVHARSDVDGRFQLAFPVEWLTTDATIADINGTIWAYAAGHSIGLGDGRFQILGQADAKPCEVRLGRAGDWIATISLLDGEPAAGARVAPVHYSHREIGLSGIVPPEVLAKASAVSDKDGRASLTAFAVNCFDGLAVVADGFGRQEFGEGGRMADGKPYWSDFTLLPTGRIEGRVVSEQAALFRNMQIEITTDDQADGQCKGTATVTPDADGRFVIPHIAPGWVVLYAAVADPRWPVRPRLIGRQQLEVMSGRTTRLEIPIEAARKVGGVVRMKGTDEPVAGAKLAIHGDDTRYEVATTDSKGRYTGAVLPGPVNLQVFETGEKNLIQTGGTWRASIPVPEGTTEFELPPVDLVKSKAVSGRLIDRDGKPLARHLVRGLVGKDRVGSGLSNDNGEFTLHRVPEDSQLDGYQVMTARSLTPTNVMVITPDPLVIQLK